MRHWILLGIYCFLLSTITHAYQSGLSLSLPLASKDPPGLHGFRASYWIQPESLIFQRCQIYFDAAVAHWYVNGTATPNQSINTYTIAPVLRAYFKKYKKFTTYLELSIGPTYISHTRFANRNLGMHFSFQDLAGVGVTFGTHQQFFVSVDTMHYSNAGMSAVNAGITIPVLIRAGYQFG